MKLTLITAPQLIEGITGGIGLIIFTLIFYKLILHKDKNIGSVLIIGLSFWLTWYWRKISVNLYNFFSKKYNLTFSNPSIDV